MPSSRFVARIALLGVLIVALVGCSSGPGPSPVIARAPASGSPSGTSSPAVTEAPASPSSGPSPSGTVEPVESAEPDPSTEPEPTPAVQPNPSARPVPPAPSDCGSGGAAFAALRDELPADLHFGGATIEFTTATIAMRDGSEVTDDAIPGGIGLSPTELAVRVDPETHIILRGDGLALTNLQAVASQWSSVTFRGGLGSWSGPAQELAWRFRSDGSISVSAPAAPGDYVIDFGLSWFSHCLQGDGVAYGRIKVNG